MNNEVNDLLFHKDFNDVKQAALYFEQALSYNSDLLTKYRITGTSEVDLKLSQARYCLALGLNWSAVVATCVALEEGLKTLIKIKLRNIETTHSEEDIEKRTLEIERQVGSLDLHGTIQKARKEGLILAEEESRLFQIKSSIRIPFLHSDKSKILTSSPTLPVTIVEIKDNQLNPVEEKTISPLGFPFAYGLFESEYCKQNARPLFLEIYNFIININDRFNETKNNNM